MRGGSRRSRRQTKPRVRIHLRRVGPNQAIQVRQDNPKTMGSASYDRYEKYKSARTVRAYKELGGTGADLAYDRKRGFVTILTEDASYAGSGEWQPGWLPTPTLCTGYAMRVEEAEAHALRSYAARAETFFSERVAAGVDPKAGADELVRLMPLWEADATFDPKRVESCFFTMDALAKDFAHWRRRGDSSKQMQQVTDLASGVFCSLLRDHSAHLVEALDDVRTAPRWAKAANSVTEWARQEALATQECNAAPAGLEGRRADSIPTPKNYSDAVRGEFAKYWAEAIEREIQNLIDHEVFKWVPRPPHRHLIDSNWAWKVKTTDKGLIDKFKARLVARGFRQIYGVDYVDTASPVGKLQTFRTLLAEAARRGMEFSFLDIRSAYLEAYLKIKQFMTPPKGVTPPEPGQVMRLDRGLYGLKQAGRRWHEKFRKNLLDWGFRSSSADSCLFVKGKGRGQLRVLLFVDDLGIFNDKTDEGRAMKADLVKSIVDEGYEYSTSDDDHVYLGMAVHRVSATALFLTQDRYIEDIMLKYGFDKCEKVHTPTDGNKVTVRDCPGWVRRETNDSNGGKFYSDHAVTDYKASDNPLGRRFRELTGALRWIEQCTRPDISAVLSELSKVQSDPGQKHLDALEHLMRYVNTTKALGLCYGGPKRQTADAAIVCYVDSDWGGDPDTFYSRGGHVFTAWQCPVMWTSQKMKAVAASSTEAEYMAASRAVRDSKWMRYLFSDLGYGDLSTKNFGKFCDRDFVKLRLSDAVDRDEQPVSCKPMTCFGDNKGANAISRNDVLHKRSKHIHIAFHIVRREVKRGHCVFGYIPTGENIADLMTKGLCRKTHEYLTNKIMFALKDGVLQDICGNIIEWGPNPQVMDELYLDMPPGLDPSAGDEERPDQVSLPSVAPNLTRAAAGEPDLMLDAIEQSAIIDSLLDSIGGSALIAIGGRTYAIIDSGASRTYASALEQLTDCLPGGGVVSVANGQCERIVETGTLGSISGARRVNSFKRTLVSVTDIVQQFGSVLFDKDGAYLLSVSTLGTPIISQIGQGTPERLYSFDGAALTAHAKRMGELGFDSLRQGQIKHLLSSWGCAGDVISG